MSGQVKPALHSKKEETDLAGWFKPPRLDPDTPKHTNPMCRHCRGGLDHAGDWHADKQDTNMSGWVKTTMAHRNRQGGVI